MHDERHQPWRCSIARDIFLTAGHCVSASTPGSQVRFNFQRDPNGNVRTTTNYAVLQLNGSPGDVWGTSTPAVFAPAAGQPITIIQHPEGIPKVVEGGTLGYTNGRMSYGDLDTEGGSSGSGILQDRTGYVIGVDTLGTSDDSCDLSDPNRGEPMERVYAQSAVVRRLAIDAAKISVIL